MAWFRKEKKPRLPRRERLEIPPDVWEKCEACGHTDIREKFWRNLNVCPNCEYHRRIRANDYANLLIDEGTVEELEVELRSTDPLGFPDYAQRLKKAMTNAGDSDALFACSGTLDALPVNLGVMDFAFMGGSMGSVVADPLGFRVDGKRYADQIKGTTRKVGPGDAYRAGTAQLGGLPVELGFFVFEFMGGSMGSVVGEKICRQFERALAHKRPAILFSASGGARMQEGVLSLMQMAKVAAILAQLAERRIPYISILTNPTTGGVSASYAMLGDAILAEPGAVIGFAGPRVIKQTLGQDLPEGFQTSEFLLDHGMLDMVVPRKELKGIVGSLLRHMSGRPAAAGWASA